MSFDTLITPKIIVYVYWLAMVAAVLGIALNAFAGNMSIVTIVGAVIGLVLLRIPFEIAMVSFKNNEYLRRIAEHLEKDGQ